jgi:hypothetical protein
MISNRILGLPVFIKGIDNLGQFTEMSTWFHDNFESDAKQELQFLYGHPCLFNLLTYLHYFWNVVLFIWIISLEVLGSFQLLQLVILAMTTAIPVLIVFLYIALIIVGFILLTFYEFVFTILMTVLIIVFSPFICIYLKCSDKDE